MTKDKQIIIDGVDVSALYPDLIACMNRYEVARLFIKTVKQLKRKEQECEELKERLNCNCFDPKSNNNRCISYNRIVEDYERDLKQLDQLKAENDELTTINARLLGRLEIDKIDTSLVFNLDKELRQKEKEFYTAIQKVVKLKQTLVKVKNMIEKSRDKLYDCDSIIYADDKLVEILDVINEVLPYDSQQ